MTLEQALLRIKELEAESRCPCCDHDYSDYVPPPPQCGVCQGEKVMTVWEEKNDNIRVFTQKCSVCQGTGLRGGTA